MLTSIRLLSHHKPLAAFYLYAPPLGLPAYRVQNELQQVGVCAWPWYSNTRPSTGWRRTKTCCAAPGRYKDYLRPLVATAGFDSAVESLRSAAMLLLWMLAYPSAVKLAPVELLAARDVNLLLGVPV